MNNKLTSDPETTGIVRVLRAISVLLLFFIGLSALFWGWQLISDPSGAKLQMPLSYLSHSPFSNYFIPGMVLFTINGILSIEISIFTIFNGSHYPKLIFIQGCLLTGWIIVQVIMIQSISYLHFLFGSIGVSLMMSGSALNTKLKR